MLSIGSLWALLKEVSYFVQSKNSCKAVSLALDSIIDFAEMCLYTIYRPSEIFKHVASHTALQRLLNLENLFSSSGKAAFEKNGVAPKLSRDHLNSSIDILQTVQTSFCKGLASHTALEAAQAGEPFRFLEKVFFEEHQIGPSLIDIAKLRL